MVIGVAALALGLVTPEVAWAKDPVFQAMQVTHPGRDTAAPEFSLTTPAGSTVAITALRGQLVFLNFWATWCPPCRLEMPSMEALHQGFKGHGLAVVAVNLRESAEEVAAFMDEVHLSFPALLDLDGEVSSRYRVHAIPTTVLIDRNGRIVGTAIGPRDWASPEAKALIRSLLGQRTGIDSGPATAEAPVNR